MKESKPEWEMPNIGAWLVELKRWASHSLLGAFLLVCHFSRHTTYRVHGHLWLIFLTLALQVSPTLGSS